MKKIIHILPLIFLLNGCSAVSHLEEIKMIQNFRDEGEQTDNYVDAYDQGFYELIAAIEDQLMDHYPDKESILAKFPEPIARKEIVRNGQAYEQWLYRRSVYFFNSARVYLIFDKNDHLIEYIYEPVEE